MPNPMESMSQRILQQAIEEERCAEFMECLWEGGSATADARTGKLVLVSGDALLALDPDAAYVHRLSEELDTPTTDSIQFLLDAFVEGGYAEQGDEVHVDAVHRWLDQAKKPQQ